MTDQFWDVRQREKAEEEALRLQLDGIERAVNLGKRALALKGSPGYPDFFKAIQDLHTHATRRMVGCDPSGEGLNIWVMKGRVEALNDVLALLDRGENALERLAAQSSRLQNELEAVKKRRPKPRSEVKHGEVL